MSVSFGFEPDPDRARALDREMHRELRSSLAYLVTAAAGLADGGALVSLLGDLDAGVVQSPGTFARYYQLVEAIEGDDATCASRLSQELACAKAADPGLRILALNDDALGAEGALYESLMNAEGALDIGFLPPNPRITADFTPKVEGGLALLDNALPQLAGEIRALLRQIVIAASDPKKRLQFDGGSHFQLWGALFLNGQFHPDALAVAEVLTHECGHCLLFGFSTKEALVENGDDELFASPLRPDPRPMDGIFHATFVSARMHWAMDQLSRSPILGRADQERAAKAAAEDLRNFHAGQEIVRAHGRLTATGQGLLEAASRYAEAQDTSSRA